MGAQSQPLGCQGSPSIGCLIVTKGPFIYKMLIQETECEVHMNSLIHLFHFSVNLKLFKYFKFIKILFLKITSTIIPFCGGSKKKSRLGEKRAHQFQKKKGRLGGKKAHQSYSIGGHISSEFSGFIHSQKYLRQELMWDLEYSFKRTWNM